MRAFENLVQFIQVIDIIFEFRLGMFARGLYVNLNNETRLTVSVDLALTTITCVVDHLLRARLEVSRGVTGNKPRRNDK